MQAWKNLQQGHYVLAGLAILLFALAGVLVREAALAMRRAEPREIAPLGSEKEVRPLFSKANGKSQKSKVE